MTKPVYYTILMVNRFTSSKRAKQKASISKKEASAMNTFISEISGIGMVPILKAGEPADAVSSRVY